MNYEQKLKNEYIQEKKDRQGHQMKVQKKTAIKEEKKKRKEKQQKNIQAINVYVCHGEKKILTGKDVS